MKLYDRNSLYTKIQNFFKMNWWLVWLSNIAIVIVVIYANYQMALQNQKIKETLEKEVQGVVFLGANGQAVFGEKQLINAASDTKFQYAIKNNLVNYLVTDAQRITKNYTVNADINVDYIYNNYLPIQEFGDNFFTRDNKKYPKALGYYKTMLAGLAQDIVSDKLPDQVIPIDSAIQTYMWNDQEQTFEIVVNVTSDVFIYNAAMDNYDKKIGTLQIRAKGYFDIADNSILNPLGIRYYEIGMTNASK
ncbi:hypothetical protein [Campylobacter sp. JMF_03 NE3]|uniref:hypothetical protein n=1 Tax=Campylobacter sp. JMF_03 NE3 TaxID=2983831 RepID=UPI0022E9DE4A|nr:hypothetical protein [Campylobacter sp. JMF_03 NE3]MDA3053512.1 hypothetical protein [Campylobacter sp. JMF_03 NE3]